MSRLLLLGGGHAQLAVLGALARRPRHRFNNGVTLISRAPRALYTGMLPGLVAGHYAREECEIDLTALCARAGIHWIESEITGFDAAARIATLADGSRHSAERICLNLGAAPEPQPGDWPSKPAEAFVDRWERLLDATPAAVPLTLAIVGGGLGAVELALAAQIRLDRRAGGGTVWLLRGTRWLPGEPPDLANKLARWLDRSGVLVVDGERAPETLDPPPAAVWRATGVRAPAWLAASGLALDPRGFVVVDAHLRSTSHPAIYAAGDLAAPPGGPWPKAGVYAVRQGPLLAANLLADCGAARRYTAAPRALALIGDGGTAALARYGDWVGGDGLAGGALAWRLKQWIDRRFVARYAVD
jgi:NADH dehydrogenase FAD-containing subunit